MATMPLANAPASPPANHMAPANPPINLALPTNPIKDAFSHPAVQGHGSLFFDLAQMRLRMDLLP
jgi:hypothetical protein